MAEKKNDLANGPIQNRDTTDILCCLIFIVFLFGMGAVFFYGLAKGKLSNITIGWDADGQGCGYSGGYEEYPYLYWNMPPEDYEAFKNLEFNELKKTVNDLMKKGVCVKTCPKTAASAVECKPTNYMEKVSICDTTTCQCDMLVEGSDIPFQYETTAIGLSGTGFCVPTITEEDTSATTEILRKMVDSIK